MAAQRESPESDHASQAERDDEAPTGTPRWVIVSGIIVLVLVATFVVLHLAGGGLVAHMPPAGGH